MTKAYYEAHKAEIRAKQVAYEQTEEGKAKRRDIMRRYDQSEKGAAKRAKYFASEKGKATLARHDEKRKHNPDRILKNMAQHKVAYALKKGRIVREDCAVCGAVKTTAHHHMGYNEGNLLNVKWLCQKHHSEAHKIMTENEAAN